MYIFHFLLPHVHYKHKIPESSLKTYPVRRSLFFCMNFEYNKYFSNPNITVKY